MDGSFGPKVWRFNAYNLSILRGGLVRSPETKLSVEDYTSTPGSPSVADDHLSIKGLDPNHLEFSTDDTASPGFLSIPEDLLCGISPMHHSVTLTPSMGCGFNHVITY